MKKSYFYPRSIAACFLVVMVSITVSAFGMDNGKGKTIVPAYGQVTLEFDQELVIIDSDSSSNAMLNFIRDFKLDSKGNIYLLDQKHPGILLFDSKGTFQREQGKMGQGPGDFLKPSRLYIDRRNFKYVFDENNYNVTGLAPGGKVILFTRFKSPPASDIFVTSGGDVYAFHRDLDQTGLVRRLAAINKKGEQVKTIAEFKDSGYMVKKDKGGGAVMGGMIHEYTPDAYLYPLDGGSFVYGYNLENNFHIYNTADEKDIVIVLPGSKIEITGKEEKYFEETCGQWAMLPTHRPFFKRLLCDEKGRTYVIRTRPVLSEEKSIEIDVFTKEGKYLYRMISPVVFSFTRDGFVYSVGKDKSGDAILNRYRIKNYRSLRY